MRSPEDIRTKPSTFVTTSLARNHVGVDLERNALVESGVIDSLRIMRLAGQQTCGPPHIAG